MTAKISCWSRSWVDSTFTPMLLKFGLLNNPSCLSYTNRQNIVGFKFTYNFFNSFIRVIKINNSVWPRFSAHGNRLRGPPHLIQKLHFYTVVFFLKYLETLDGRNKFNLWKGNHYGSTQIHHVKRGGAASLSTNNKTSLSSVAAPPG